MMARSTPVALLLCLLASLVAADFSITKPVYGTTFTATEGVTLVFKDDGNAPTFSDISSTKVLLCTGSNSDINCLATVTTFVPGSLTQVAVPLANYAALGSNGPYFFQLYSVASDGYSIQYSPRFTLSGMTGTLKASAGGDSDPPDAQVNVGEAAGAASTVNSASLTLTYTLQTGKTRYAPMQMQPGSKVTYKLSASRRYPTSAVSYFTAYQSKPYPVTTVTPSWSYTITQGPNWASTLPSPTGYYAASEALSRNINAKSRRGYVDL